MSFGTILKKLRLDKGFTQEELAKKVNTSRSNIANYEVNKNMPSIDMLEKLSEALGVTTDILLGKQDTFNSDLLRIGLSLKDYNLPTENQMKQIEEFAKLVLKDNKKEQ